jgi:CelD/BcsL family acetyltransferase involved in cellulose biosynthesis
MRVKLFDDFDSLEACWNSFLKNSLTGNNIFLTWEWLSIWWKHFGKGRELLVLAAEEEGKTLAIAPFMLSKYPVMKFGHISKIEFLGAPQSDYSNFIFIERENECLRSFINYLESEVSGWDVIELKELPESQLTKHLVDSILDDHSIRLHKKTAVCNICPYIPLPSSSEIFVNNLSHSQRYNLNRSMKKLARSFAVDFKDYADLGFSIVDAMNLFFRLHEMRWNGKGQSGVLAESDVQAFHLDIAKCFAEKSWLALYFLTLNNQPVSAHYGFEYGKKMYWYLSGFNTEYTSYSIGNIGMKLLIEKCINSGFSEFDLLRGEEAYKSHWTSAYRKNFEIILARTNLFSLNYAVREKIKNAQKKRDF